ncbi:hypothetical protein AMATHDRAFT_61107 [Amanita thiersii Skay4041]|uniref:NADAR domain-containing protein n=1 Tax=Amanita thiersii Skay4041 TaxID=703135 RepID=A0A2A9NQ85_9AGAR|nr:hypothetical protein AMATHDRAFT_61107 [Amanita thiersii Skay4041]
MPRLPPPPMPFFGILPPKTRMVDDLDLTTEEDLKTPASSGQNASDFDASCFPAQLDATQRRIIREMIGRRVEQSAPRPANRSMRRELPNALPARNPAYRLMAAPTAYNTTSVVSPKFVTGHMQNSSSPAPPSANTSVQSSFLFNDEDPYDGFNLDSPHPIEYGRYTYDTATHAIEAMKYWGHDFFCADEIRRCKSAGEARWLSAKFASEGKLPAGWEDHSFNVVQQILFEKFAQHASLQKLLLNTPNVPLVYKNGDGYWGIGHDGKGLNVLGMALDKVKSLLKEHGNKSITNTT